MDRVWAPGYLHLPPLNYEHFKLLLHIQPGAYKKGKLGMGVGEMNENELSVIQVLKTVSIFLSPPKVIDLVVGHAKVHFVTPKDCVWGSLGVKVHLASVVSLKIRNMLQYQGSLFTTISGAWATLVSLT